MDNVTAKVARQYTDYAYPEPFEDLDERLARGQFDACDPRLFGPMLWPEGRPEGPLRILSAGCGTVQAAVLAHSNRDASVVGVDLSDASLGHQRYLREKFDLQNLELFQGDIVDVAEIGREFDLIVCSGVLHHLRDPDAGLRALRSVLAPQGAMFVMVYAPIGRTGVYLMQDAFRTIGLRQTPEDIELVRAVLKATPSSHPVAAFAAWADDVHYDAGIVDIFLHPQDRSYSVEEVLDWVERAGLGFQGWLDNMVYFPHALVSPAILPRIEALPLQKQWAVVEKLVGMTAKQEFYLRHPGSVHQVSFEGDHWLQYRPYWFPVAELKQEGDGGFRIHRTGQQFIVGEPEAILFSWGDGTRTIAQMLDEPPFSAFPENERREFARAHFTRMWRMGLMMFQK